MSRAHRWQSAGMPAAVCAECGLQRSPRGNPARWVFFMPGTGARWEAKHWSGAAVECAASKGGAR